MDLEPQQIFLDGTAIAAPSRRGPRRAAIAGQVRVADTYHFAYADGTPYRELGTTSYAWQHQPEARCTQTLRTLPASPFNKIRMAVFPNASVHTEPLFPFERLNGTWTYEINPAFFQNLDRA